MLSAEQNDSQSGETNVIDVIARAGSWNSMKKSFLGRPLCLLCLAAAQKIAHAVHSLSRLGELHVKAGNVSTLLAR